MDFARQRPAEPAVGLGVYVHVPFCRRRCDYCAFATWTGREAIWERYMAACATQAKALGGDGWGGRGPATSVYFGGGTPSLVPAEQLGLVLDALSSSVGLSPSAEVTVECNPETLSPAKLASYKRAGVNRLSLGAQSMVPHVLASLGRQHEPAAVHRAAQAAGEAGFAGAYSVDLIFGAAGETVADWEASLQAVLALQPPPAHLSCYALTVEAGTRLAKDPSRHPDDDDQAAKYVLADKILSDAGYSWYEISNWARPGAECRHNLLYWLQGEYAGVGCAAHSHRLTAGGTSRRWWNVRSPERYCRLVAQGESVDAGGEHLGPSERAYEALMLSLRTSLGVPHGALPAEVYEQGLAERRHLRAGALAGDKEGERGVLTLRGRLLANEVAARLRPPPQASCRGVA
jgi:putative oxygen-independent coproporphyrinogen III oxidase